MISTVLMSLIVYLFIGWLTVPISILLFPDESECIEITLGDLFKFSNPVWYVIILFWPIVWIIILIELCRKLSNSEIVIWKRERERERGKKK